jgi:hypothetical protein
MEEEDALPDAPRAELFGTRRDLRHPA